jgi:hypothetical protein
MLDYWHDGRIDCKDYAVFNSITIKEKGYAPYWLVTKNHVIVAYDDGAFTYIHDVERVYRLPRGLLKGLGLKRTGNNDNR